MGYNEEKNELTHWGNNNGKHKYVDKKMVNGKWRYFYENGPSSLQTRVKNTMAPSKVAQRKAIRNAQYKQNVNKMIVEQLVQKRMIQIKLLEKQMSIKCLHRLRQKDKQVQERMTN